MKKFTFTQLTTVTLLLSMSIFAGCSASSENKIILREASPDTVFRQYMKAIAAAEPWETYQVYLTENFIDKSEKQLARYTVEEKKQMKSLSRTAAKCSDDKLLAEKNTHKTTRKLIYAIINHCSEQDTFYRQVVFKQENGWKIDDISIAIENIY